MKPLALVLSLLLPSCLLHILEHEDAHYEVAQKYGLEPRTSYVDRRTDYNIGTRNQNLDVIGAGLAKELSLGYETNFPNSIYALYSLYEFNGRSNDGRDYLEMMPEEKNNIERAFVINSLVLLSQWACKIFDTSFFIKSRAEIDRRGSVFYYEINWKINF